MVAKLCKMEKTHVFFLFEIESLGVPTFLRNFSMCPTSFLMDKVAL
jgi:hypothetical protein